MRSTDGFEHGRLHIKLTDKSPAESLVERIADAGDGAEVEAVQLLESCSYRFLVELDTPEAIDRLDPAELIECDDDTNRTGRLAVRENVGRLKFSVWTLDGQEFRAHVEVRSKKLDYLTDYQRMLADITTLAVGLAAQRFAPVTLPLDLAPETSPDTIYLGFEVLRSLLFAPDVQAAFGEVVSRPHTTWVTRSELRRPGQGLRAEAAVVRQLVRGRNRVRLDPPIGLLDSVPQQVATAERITTYDNPPNRFVRFALEHWRDLTQNLRAALEKQRHQSAGGTAPVERGVTIADQVLERLDSYLRAPIFREVGQLTTTPSGDQVLQKKSGYRRILSMFHQVELGVRMHWKGGEQIASAGRRDVAALYEYWVFLQLAELIQRLGGGSLDAHDIVTVDDHGLTMHLERSKEAMVWVDLAYAGRPFTLKLYFNRTFKRAENHTWSRNMRPDCSLEIIRRGDSFPAQSERKWTWLLFDAKYKVHEIETVMATDAADGGSTPLSKATHGDLQIMHAYRDAIRRTVGSYVIFPGSGEERLTQYSELLPGVGAFAMRPAVDGQANGTETVRSFLEDVLAFLAKDSSKEARAAYWHWQTYEEEMASSPPTPQDETRGGGLPVTDLRQLPLNKPPRDIPVTVGYVRPENWDWVLRERWFPMRADSDRAGFVPIDSELLRPDFLLLYTVDHSGTAIEKVALFAATGVVEIRQVTAMDETGYKAAKGWNYICVQMGPAQIWPSVPSRHDSGCVERLLQGLRLFPGGAQPPRPLAERAAPQRIPFLALLNAAVGIDARDGGGT